jgi:hypothetical protein
MKNAITICIIGVLLAIILIQKACTSNVEKPKTNITVTSHTVYLPLHDTIHNSPKLIEQIPSDIPSEYTPDTNYLALKKQYEKLVNEHLSQNIYKDELNLDTLGDIVIRDTTQFNKLTKRSYEFNLRVPKRIDSIFINKEAPQKRQLYVGVGVVTIPTISELGIRGSLLYKDKKDNTFSPSVTLNTNGVIIYGIDTYFKIKLKK